MRLFRSTVMALATISSTVSANVLHQHQQRAPLADVCANVDANLAILGIVAGRIDLCLCVSALPVFVTTNLIAIIAVALPGGGTANVIAALTALINAAADSQDCEYPEHSCPHCDAENPCDFTCKDGFSPYPTTPAHHPTDCVCHSPKTVCNGKCGYFDHCSSQPAKRDASWREATCPQGWSACGVWGGIARVDYECVDVRKDLWSCGGCGIPLLPTDPIGVDCTAIQGVHDVSCLSGRCSVQRCKDGFEVSSDRTTCVPTTRIGPNTPVFIGNGGGHYKAREAEAEA